MAFRLLRAAGIAAGSSLIALLGTSTASAQVVDFVQPELYADTTVDTPTRRVQPQSRHQPGGPQVPAHQVAVRLALGHAGVVIDSRTARSVIDYTARTPSLWQTPLRGLLH